MPEPTTTPEGAPQGDSAEVADGTPQEQPGQQPAVATPPANAKPEAVEDVELLRRAYTQGQQSLSTVRNELGLPKGASSEELLAAIRQLKATPSQQDDGDFGEDPRIAQQRAQLEQRAWDYEVRIYGDTAKEARQLADAVRATNDPSEITALFHKAVMRVTEDASAEGEPEGGAADAGAGGEAAEQDDIELGAGDAPLVTARKPPAPAQGMRMADYFRQLGIGQRSDRD